MRATRDDRGSAILEFVFVAVVLTVPLIYLLVAVSVVQGAETAAAQAAREAGRAFATAETAAGALGRAEAATRIALAHQSALGQPELRFVAARDSCAGRPVTPILQPGVEYAVCVRLRVAIPAVPRFVAGRGFTAIGRYVVHVDDYRSA